MGEVELVEFFLRDRERRPYIEQVRPGVPQIGQWLRRLHDELLRGVGGKQPDRWHEAPPLTPDNTWHSGLGAEEEEVVLNVAHLLATAVRDHLLALAILAESDAPTRSLLAMSRVLFDASCKARFVLEPGLRDRVRVTRAANLELLSYKEEANDAATDELRDRLVATGHYRATKDGTQLQRGLDPKTIQEVAGPEGPLTYHLLSSAVHSVERSWIRTFTGGSVVSGNIGGHHLVFMWTAPLQAVISAILAIQEFYGLRGAPLETETLENLRTQISFATRNRDDEIWAAIVAAQPELAAIWDPADPPLLPSR
jgi:hypothetical protein